MCKQSPRNLFFNFTLLLYWFLSLGSIIAELVAKFSVGNALQSLARCPSMELKKKSEFVKIVMKSTIRKI